MCRVTWRGLTDGNALSGDATICFQPASIDPSHVELSGLPAVHAYALNERSAVNRLLPGTSSADTARLSIGTGFVVPSVTTTQRPATGAPVWPSFVASLSSMRLPRVVLVPVSPTIVAPCVADA